MTLVPLWTSSIWTCFPVTTRTRAPIAVRLHLVPTSLILIQFCLFPPSLRSSDGAGELFADARPHLCRNVFEAAVPQIPVNQPRVLVGLVEVVVVNLRIDVAVCLDNFLPAVLFVLPQPH